MRHEFKFGTRQDPICFGWHVRKPMFRCVQRHCTFESRAVYPTERAIPYLPRPEFPAGAKSYCGGDDRPAGGRSGNAAHKSQRLGRNGKCDISKPGRWEGYGCGKTRLQP